MSIFTALFVFMGVYINELNSCLYSAIGIGSGWAFVFISKQNLEIKEENEALLAQLDTIKEMYNTEVECNLKQRDKIDALRLEVDEKYQELSLLRQKYSRTNQPRSGGRFVKGENFISKVGDRFKCNRDFIMNEGWVAFTSGRTYLCEADGCLTDNQGYYMHGMGEDNIKLYFTRVRQ